MFTEMELPEKLLIGLSGGADSVALAYLMRQEKLSLTAVHVNHGLRGAESDQDEAFVRRLCSEWQLPLMVYRAVPPEHSGEDWARQVRYGFFREAMADSGAQAIALAHHRDDQAETFLLHLLRGAGLDGLCGMAKESRVLGVRVVRPLLDMTRQELRDILTAAGIPWREDGSNRDTKYLRNALRRELLPMMERLAPGAAGRIATAAALLQEDAEVLEQLTREVVQGRERYLLLSTLQGMLPGLRNRVLRQWWQCAGPKRQERSLSIQQTEALNALVEAPVGSRCNLPGGWQGYRGWTHLHLVGDVPQSLPVVLKNTPGAAKPGDGRLMQAMPVEQYAGTVVRQRQPGDWIIPFGSRGRQALQDYFVNRHVDAPFRDDIPLLCRGSQVLLVAGVGAGAVQPFDEAKDNLTLFWEGEMPWMQK